MRDLLVSLQDRGFTLHCERLLAVIAGAKALKKALRLIFGKRVLIARCWLHKLCNLRADVPERAHGTLFWRLKKLRTLAILEHCKKMRQGRGMAQAPSLIATLGPRPLAATAASRYQMSFSTLSNSNGEWDNFCFTRKATQ